jgi:hypothetical protein
MALYSELPVYKATYDLLLAIFRFTKDFGKEYCIQKLNSFTEFDYFREPKGAF